MPATPPAHSTRWATLRRWWLSGWVTAVAVFSLVGAGPPKVFDVAFFAAMLVAAWMLSPWFFPSSPTDAEARRQAAETGAPIIYWRPGCSYCLRLRIALGGRGRRAVWVDVTQDPAASARVRGANAGDETVPTVFVDGSATVNPSVSWVRDHLQSV